MARKRELDPKFIQTRIEELRQAAKRYLDYYGLPDSLCCGNLIRTTYCGLEVKYREKP